MQFQKKNKCVVKKKSDPNDFPWFEVKFNKLKYTTLRKHRYERRTQSASDKALEIEGIHIIKTIEDYGFRFFAMHYLGEKIHELEAIANQLR